MLRTVLTLTLLLSMMTVGSYPVAGAARLPLLPDGPLDADAPVACIPAPVGPRAPVAGAAAAPAGRYFPETGHSLSGDFRQYWEANDGLLQFGYPLTEPFVWQDDATGTSYTVQYFERARFEAHPDLGAGTTGVVLARLGALLQTPAPAVPTRAEASYFPATGHNLAGAFRAYWEANGGLPLFGLPLTEEIAERNPADGRTYTVQYFERARFESHPENAAPYDVLLGLLGEQALDCNPAQVAAPLTPAPPAAAPTGQQRVFGMYFPIQGAGDPAILGTIDRYIAASPKVGALVFDVGVSQGMSGPPPDAVRAALARAQAAGIKVLIYISTYYGSGAPKQGHLRDLAAMHTYVDQAYAWFAPDGIFFDEVQYDPGTRYYADLYSYVKNKPNVRDRLVWMNAAGWTPSDWMMSVCDVAIIFEGHTPNGTGYGDFTGNWAGTSGQGWAGRYPPSRIAASVQNVTTPGAVNTVLALAQQRNIGWLYITDTDDQSSPPGYGHIPADPLWSTLLAGIR